MLKVEASESDSVCLEYCPNKMAYECLVVISPASKILLLSEVYLALTHGILCLPEKPEERATWASISLWRNYSLDTQSAFPEGGKAQQTPPNTMKRSGVLTSLQ